MKFGKRFAERQLRGGVYLDYKRLKKALKLSSSDGKDPALREWTQTFWDDINRVNHSMANRELELIIKLRELVGAAKDGGDSALKGQWEFLEDVRAFLNDVALNLIACVKICKKRDKIASPGTPVLTPELGAWLVGKRLMGATAHSILVERCKPYLQQSLNEEMLLSYAALRIAQLDGPQTLVPRAASHDEKRKLHLPLAEPLHTPQVDDSPTVTDAISTATGTRPDLPRPSMQSGTSLSCVHARRQRATPKGWTGHGVAAPGQGQAHRSATGTFVVTEGSAGSLSTVERGSVDPALIFSMERTFLSALNQAFYLMLIGAGMMAINDYDDGAVAVGSVIFILAIICVAVTYYMHTSRLNLLKHRKPITTRWSKAWLAVLTWLAIVAAIIEIIYMYVYPLLDRAKSVEVVTEGQTPASS